MKENTLVEIKWYLQSIKPLFVNGQLRLVSEDGIMKITYKDSFLDFTVKEKVNIKDKQAKTQIHMFCFSMYCDYEWDWQPKNAEFIWKLLCLKPHTVSDMISDIYKKLHRYAEPIFWEEKEVTNLQNHWQELEWSMIQEKHGTRFPWSEKERFEVPLW